MPFLNANNYYFSGTNYFGGSIIIGSSYPDFGGGGFTLVEFAYNNNPAIKFSGYYRDSLYITRDEGVVIPDTNGLKVTGGIIRAKGYTVSTLPAGTLGDTAYVTDATSPTYLGTLTGGGSVKTPVFYNGTAWVSY